MDADPFNADFLISLVFLSPDMQILRVTLGSLGIGFIAASITSYSVHSFELIPTLLRYKRLWML